MTKHVHIATVGIRPYPVTRAINAIGGIDVLYLLYTADDEKMDDSYAIERRIISEDENGTINYASPGGTASYSGTKNNNGDANRPSNNKDEVMTSRKAAIEIEKRIDIFIDEIHRVVIPLRDYWGIVHKITDIFEKERGEGVEFSINITGGTNLMLAAACYTSYYAHADLWYMDMSRGTVEEKLLKIDRQSKVDIDSMEDLTKDALKEIYKKSKNKEQITTSEIARSLHISHQKLKYHIDKLVSQNLIKKEDYYDGNRINGTRKNLKITELGAIIATYIK